jgi:hypothetical protein
LEVGFLVCVLEGVFLKVKVNLLVRNEVRLTDEIEIDDIKLEELDDEEVESAIEVVVRNWANNQIAIAWEAEREEQQ